MKNIKTLDIQAKEWFDRINGNSYFAGIITVNFGLKNEREYTLDFQYGYGDFYLQASKSRLVEAVELSNINNFMSLSQYCRENNIILRSNIKTNCTKKEILNFIN
jgi:hypothetical protein